MGKLDIVHELFGEQVYIKTKKLIMNMRTPKEVKELRMVNKKYHNIHNGKRCFILGNGPSLRNVDLSLLSDEIVFSCNNFARVKNFQDAKSNYHLWVDEAFFEMRDENKMSHEELMYNYQAMAQVSPVCFVPMYGKKYLHENKIDDMLNINYFDIFEWIRDGGKVLCDLDEYITGFTTVVQYAVVIAIYMGFKEIYLLGCDSTNILAMLNIAMDIENKEIHAYDTDDAKERYTRLLKKWNIADLFRDQYTFFLGYRMLNAECIRRGIVFKNLSEVTLIDEVERDCLANVLGDN